MMKYWLYIYTITLVIPGLWLESAQAETFDYTPTRLTEKIQIIYGPFDLPDRKNHGFRNNVVIVSTNKGIVILDPGGSAYAGEMVAKTIKSVTQSPIVAIFNSHAHGDHWLGNEGVRRHFPDVLIYGHPTMKTKVEGAVGDFWLETINRVTEGTANGKRVVAPNKVVNNGDEVRIGNTVFRIYHTGTAHTDNDIMIEIVGENALFMGDIVRNGLLGIMEEDASFKKNISAINFIINKNFKYNIPGHGMTGDAQMPVRYRIYLETLRNKVQELYEKGMADFEMKTAVVDAVNAYKKWAGFDTRVGPHISRAYLEIEAEDFQ